MKTKSFKLPPNEYGFICYHTEDNLPLSDEFLNNFLKNIMPPIELKYQEELSKIITLTKEEYEECKFHANH